LVDEDFIDADQDGLHSGEDCNDSDPEILGPVPFYRDSDNDGFGNALNSELACIVPPGFVDDNTDCDDNDSDTNPEASEILGDLKDNNCNGLVDEFILEDQPIIIQILSQIQDILAAILGLDTRVTELEDKVIQLEEKVAKIESTVDEDECREEENESNESHNSDGPDGSDGSDSTASTASTTCPDDTDGSNSSDSSDSS